MLRQWHALTGLILALMLAVTAGSGAILAFDAFAEARSAPAAPADAMPLNELAGRIVAHFPDVRTITRTPSGRLRVTFSDNGRPRTGYADPQTGAAVATPDIAPLMRDILNLHRAWLAGDGGRMIAGYSALAMLLLSLSGLVLLRRRLGGWHKLAGPIGATGARRWHLELGRLACAGLLLSSLTAIELSLTGFEIIPDGAAAEAPLAPESTVTRLPVSRLGGLATLSLDTLRQITFPQPDDAAGPVTVTTGTATRYIDAASGDILREDEHGLAWQVHDIAFRLHTAQGMAWLALLLGISAAGGVVLALTGFATGWARRRHGRGVSGSVAADRAEVLVLVGSEGGTTWRFARMLHGALTTAGRTVHIAAMNDIPAASPARLMIVLAATAGEGEAPASARRFISRLVNWTGNRPDTIVLGFGDRQFPNFCGFADQVETALRAHGFRPALTTVRVDRQAAETVAGWTRQLGEYLDLPLVLAPQADTLRLHRFELARREDYGIEVQAPTAVLRFRIVPKFRSVPFALQHALGLAPRFDAGDLVAIVPPGHTRARYYSIASSSRSGELELCVRHQPGGACSGHLFGLQPGATLTAAIRHNPSARPADGPEPLILIGAGAGMAPLIGHLRRARGARPVHLYWGGRHPHSDHLYRHELEAHARNGTLTCLRTIFSRIGSGGYVQDLVAHDAATIRAAIAAGGQVLICGGRTMAEGVRTALGAALAPIGMDVDTLRRTGRLIEDVY